MEFDLVGGWHGVPSRHGRQSRRIEWSLIWLVVGILGMVFLFFSLIGTGSTVQPTYDRDSQIAPRNERGAPERSAEPEVGADAQTEST